MMEFVKYFKVDGQHYFVGVDDDGLVLVNGKKLPVHYQELQGHFVILEYNFEKLQIPRGKVTHEEIISLEDWSRYE